MTELSETHDLNIPTGAPVWMDLVTNDQAAAGAFYADLFGWTIQEAPPEFGGYQIFLLDGQPVGGSMKNEAEWNAPNAWSVLLRSDSVKETAEKVAPAGGTVVMGPMDVAENGGLLMATDAGGAMISAWEPRAEKGFGVMNTENAPDHFELHTRDYDKTVAFYRDAFGWSPVAASDEPTFRYTTFAEGDNVRAGIMDATAHLPEDVPAHWAVYIRVENTEKAVARAQELGATVLQGPDATPFGNLATLTDPTGAMFRLRD